MDVFTISDLASEFDISTRTIRYYEEVGLIKPLERQAGKQRLYNRRARARLKLALRGKKFGFSLNEIKEIIDMYDVDPTEKSQLEKLIGISDDKLFELDEKIEELKLLRGELSQLRNHWCEKLSKIENKSEEKENIGGKRN